MVALPEVSARSGSKIRKTENARQQDPPAVRVDGPRSSLSERFLLLLMKLGGIFTDGSMHPLAPVAAKIAAASNVE